MSKKGPLICALALAIVSGGLLFLAPGETLLRLGVWAGALLIYAGMLGVFGWRFAFEGLIIAILLAGLATGALFAIARVRAAPGHTRTDTTTPIHAFDTRSCSRLIHPSSTGELLLT